MLPVMSGRSDTVGNRVYAGDVGIDHVGRMVVPVRARKALGIQTQDTLLAYVDARANEIVLKVSKRHCMACGGTEELRSYKDVILCAHCLMEMKNDG